MRTTGAIIAVLLFGFAFTVVSGAGLAGAWGIDNPLGGSDAAGAFGDAGEQSPGGEGSVGGSAQQSSGETDIVSLTLDGARFFGFVVGKIALLPITLNQLGLPLFAAAPIGLFAQFLGGVGLIQFIGNRVWR